MKYPNLVGSVYPTHQTPNDWINASAFQTPATGTVGNLGLMSIKGPDFFDWDMALSRTFATRFRAANLASSRGFLQPHEPREFQ